MVYRSKGQEPLDQLTVQSIATEFGDDVAKYLELAKAGIRSGALIPVKVISDMMLNTKAKSAVVNLLKEVRLDLPL